MGPIGAPENPAAEPGVLQTRGEPGEVRGVPGGAPHPSCSILCSLSSKGGGWRRRHLGPRSSASVDLRKVGAHGFAKMVGGVLREARVGDPAHHPLGSIMPDEPLTQGRSARCRPS